jgi:hypothetical protein
METKQSKQSISAGSFQDCSTSRNPHLFYAQIPSLRLRGLRAASLAHSSRPTCPGLEFGNRFDVAFRHLIY